MRIIRTLLPAELRCYRDHLCRLDAEARRARFGSTVSEFAIGRHVDQFRDAALSASVGGAGLAAVAPGADPPSPAAGRGHRQLIACFSNAVTVIGAVEVSANGEGEGELAFSIEKPFRGRGLGRILFDRALLAARNRGIRRLMLAVQTDNVAMRRLASRAGCTFTLFDGLAESVLELPPPSTESILGEARFERSGTTAWLAAAVWWIASSSLRLPAIAATPMPMPTPLPATAYPAARPGGS